MNLTNFASLITSLTNSNRSALVYGVVVAATNSIVSDTNALVKALESGAVCRQIGHRWVQGCDNPDCQEHSKFRARNCAFCNRVEVQVIKVEWAETNRHFGPIQPPSKGIEK